MTADESLISSRGLAKNEIDNRSAGPGVTQCVVALSSPLVASCSMSPMRRTVRRLPKGTVLGELESGNDFFNSRYLYEIVAGEKGCEVIRINRSLFTELLEPGAKDTLPSRLFTVLRDRMSTYSWVHHKAVHIRKGTEKDARLEYLARMLLLGSTMEKSEGRALTEARPDSNGMSFLCDLVKLQEQVLGADPKLNEENDTTYGKQLQLLTAMAVVEQFTPGPREASRDRNAIDVARKTLWDMAIEKMYVDRLRQKHSSLEKEELRSLLTSFGSLSLLEGKRMVRHVARRKFELSKDAREAVRTMEYQLFRSLQKEHVLDREFVESVIRRFYLNLAFLNWVYFSREGPWFFVINDLYMLRRIACGDGGWKEELNDRRSYSPYLQGNRAADSSLEGEADFWRFPAYVDRFVSFVGAYWRSGNDLRLCHDRFLGEPSFIESAAAAFDEQRAAP